MSAFTIRLRCESPDLPQTTKSTAVTFLQNGDIDKAAPGFGQEHVISATIITGALTTIKLHLEQKYEHTFQPLPNTFLVYCLFFRPRLSETVA